MARSPRPDSQHPAPPARSETERVRLDVLMVERGLAPTREKAQALVLAGVVLVEGRPARRSAEPVRRGAQVAAQVPDGFVSRGGLKLAHALDRFAIDPTDRVCLDAGASTGGFTDCLVRRGARRVYAVDVGHGQLDWGLRNDPRVVVRERTNVRHLESLPEPIDLAVIDVSFISLRLVFPTVGRLVCPGGPIVALVKPQFEAGRGQVGRGGVVRDPAVHRRVLLEVWAWCAEHGFIPRGLTASPIRGPAGNVEFLLFLLNASLDHEAGEDGAARGDPDIEDAVQRALDEAPGQARADAAHPPVPASDDSPLPAARATPDTRATPD